MNNLVFRLSLLLVAAIPHASSASADAPSDTAALRNNLIDYFVTHPESDDVVQPHLDRRQPDGTWSDIDYASQRRSGWPTCNHLRRILEMARIYRNPDHPLAGSGSLRESIIKALDHWLEHDYRNPNWWNARIGVPQAVAPTLILMGDDLPDATRTRAIGLLLDRSKMGMTGQNKVWVAGIAFMKGLLKEDTALMQKARDAIVSELRITTREGMQADFSFHQHGPQQQWGNYGGEFGKDMVQWAAIFHGTSLALTPAQRDLLRNYLLEGSSWVVWRDRMDTSGCGRRVFPNWQSYYGERTIEQVRLMAGLDPDHAELFERVLISQDPESANQLVGSKHYWRSDISVHRRPSWYASVKMSSTRVIGAESCNSENLLGLHLGDGATYFHVSGREYENIYPLWNWRRLPGTTCCQNDGPLKPGSRQCRGQSDFVGGATDGLRGLAAMEYRRNGLEARKSWFFLDHAVVCLGAGITSEQPEEVDTSIEQCNLIGPVTTCRQGRIQQHKEPRLSIEEADWIHHGLMGYRLLKPRTVEIECAQRSGDWATIHGPDRAGAVNGQVFSLWMSHGPAPRAADYAYAVYPDTTAESMPGIIETDSTTILELTEAVQAISTCEGRLTLAAFFEPGSLTLKNGTTIEVDRPCLVMHDATAKPTRWHVAEPTHRQTSLTLHVRRPNSAARTLHVDLPRDGRAGETIEIIEPQQTK